MRYNANDIETNYQLNRNYNSTIKNIQIESISQSYLFKDDISNNIFLIFLRIYSLLLVSEAISPVRQDTLPVRQDTSLVRQDILPVSQDTLPVRQDTSLVRQDILPVRQVASPVCKMVSLVRKMISLVHKIPSMRIYWTIFMKYYCHLCMYFQSVNHYFQTISLRFYWYSYNKNLLLRSSLYLIMVRKPVHPHPLRHLWQGNDADQLSKRWDPELPAIA